MRFDIGRMEADTERRDLLLGALKRRRVEVETWLGVDVRGLPPENEGPEPPDAERTLRIVMVVLFPKIVARRFTAEEAQKYVSLLVDLTSPALGPDLRFIDAWNNAFEALTRAKPADPTVGTLITSFCRRYAWVLDHKMSCGK